MVHVARSQYDIKISEGVLAALPPADMFVQPPPEKHLQAVVTALEALPPFQPNRCTLSRHNTLAISKPAVDPHISCHTSLASPTACPP